MTVEHVNVRNRKALETRRRSTTSVNLDLYLVSLFQTSQPQFCLMFFPIQNKLTYLDSYKCSFESESMPGCKLYESPFGWDCEYVSLICLKWAWIRWSRKDLASSAQVHTLQDRLASDLPTIMPSFSCKLSGSTFVLPLVWVRRSRVVWFLFWSSKCFYFYLPQSTTVEGIVIFKLLN